MEDNKESQLKSGSLVCRKCSGPHLTIKCGKDKKEPEKIQEPVIFQGRKTYAELKESFNKNNNITDEIKQDSIISHNEFVERDRKPIYKQFKSTYRVKLSNLPTDMTEEEMMELTCDWGNIIKIKVLTYEESSTAYIDFGYNDESKYFIEAIDKTPFDHLILSAVMVESNNYKPT
jgi:hypothetical protein